MAALNWIEKIEAYVGQGDAVYFDSVNGVDGKEWPVGTPALPVKNETDLRAILTARKLTKVVLRNPGTTLQFTSTLSGIIFQGEGEAALCPTVDFNAQAITCTFINLQVTDTAGDNLVSASEFWNCFILKVIAHTVGGANYHDCKFDAGGVTNPPLGIINLYDDCQFLGTLNNTTGTIYSWGDIYITGDFVTGWVYLYKDCFCDGIITVSDALFMVYGALKTDGLIILGESELYVFGEVRTHSLTGSPDGSMYFYTGGIFGGPIEVQGEIAGNLRGNGKDNRLDFNLSNSGRISFVSCQDSLNIREMVAGATAKVEVTSGVLTIDDSCTGGTIDLYGDCWINDQAGGAVTINDYRTGQNPTPTTGSHDITTANDKTETDVVALVMTGAWSLSIYLDLATLVTAVEGGTVTVRYYSKIDGTNYAQIRNSVFVVGTDTVMPSCEITKGYHGFKCTIQCSTDVTATRAVPYVYIINK